MYNDFVVKIQGEKSYAKQKKRSYASRSAISLTIPALLVNSSTAINQAAFKREYAVVSEALVSANYNGIDTTSSDTLIASLGNQLRYVDSGPMSNLGSYPIYFYNSDVELYDAQSWGSTSYAKLNDGTTILYYNDDSSCGFSEGNLNGICGELYFDTNGNQGENREGQDINSVWLYKDTRGIYRITPKGSMDDGYQCTLNQTSEADDEGCATQILFGGTIPQPDQQAVTPMQPPVFLGPAQPER